ncbi:NeuD/PglB/VioB family sugar acetyltransferase [Rapidithrix thailandica]|uniref:NeuD/PglB/VioB family sugar acetyltransferase n=1 Tax=Rapidithrix thailandica TaxID=413964 RepID=A0AAW9SEM6_9BACT
MENPVIILGATSAGKQALEIFKSLEIEVYCFLDDDKELHNTEISDVSVMGHTRDDGFLKFIGKRCEVFVGINENEERKELVEFVRARRKVQPVNAIHPLAYVASSAHVGHGNLINVGAVVNAGAEVKNACMIQSKAVVETDVVLEDYVSVGTGAIINANCTVGEGSLIGSGAILAPGVKIGKNVQVAPGSLVMQNVDDNQVVFGVPAKSV